MLNIVMNLMQYYFHKRLDSLKNDYDAICVLLKYHRFDTNFLYNKITIVR